LHRPLSCLARAAPQEEKREARRDEGVDMLDIIFIALTLIFFAAALWYVRFCERI
jgi:hypothetical protein